MSAAHQYDLALVRRYLSGDESARVELMERLGCVRRFLQVLNRCRRRPLGSVDLDDVHQDVWLILLKALPRFKGKSTLETWAYSIASRALARFLHARNQSIMPLAVDESVSAGSSLVDASANIERHLRLLPPRPAAVLRLRFVLGLAFRDIARELGISIPSAKTYYRRGIATLKDYLPPDEED